MELPIGHEMTLIERYPLFVAGWDISPDRGNLILKKATVIRMRHNDDCGVASNVFLYCVEADAKFCSVKNFISLPKIRILFCIPIYS